MFKFFSFWKQPEKVTETTKTEAVSMFLLKSNEMFVNFLNNCSWLVYGISGLVIVGCIYYYINDCKRRSILQRQRESFQRSIERQPQRRRPGGIHRDHEIFRNAIKTVRQYIGGSQRHNSNPLVLKRTRSGMIYGSYSSDTT